MHRLKELVSRCGVVLECERNYRNGVFDVFELCKTCTNQSDAKLTQLWALSTALNKELNTSSEVTISGEGSGVDGTDAPEAKGDGPLFDKLFVDGSWVVGDNLVMFADPEVDQCVKFVKSMQVLLRHIDADIDKGEAAKDAENELIEIFCRMSQAQRDMVVQKLGHAGALYHISCIKELSPGFWSVIENIVAFLQTQEKLDPLSLMQAFTAQMSTGAVEVEDDQLEAIKTHIQDVGKLIKGLPLTSSQTKQLVTQAEGLLPVLVQLQENNADLDMMDLMMKLAPFLSPESS